MHQNLFVIGGMALLILVGAGIICFGFYLRKHSTIMNTKSLRRQLVSWRILEQGNESSSVVEHLVASFSYIQVYALIGSGCSIILSMIVMAGISFLEMGPLQREPGLNGLLVSPIAILSCLVGLALGSVIGIWRLQRATSHGVNYSDVRQRRLTDYRSSLLRWILVALVGWMILMTALLAPSVGLNAHMSLLNGSSFFLPNTLWIWGIVAFLLFVLVVFEVLLTQIALVSRLLVFPDPMFARRVDDMFRSTIIGIIQQGELSVLGFLCMIQCFLLLYNIGNADLHSILSSPIFPISLFLPTFLFLFGAPVISLLRGRLGGRVNGWPWNKGFVR